MPSRSKKLALLSALAAGVCLSGGLAAAAPTAKGCPTPEETGTMLGQASAFMEQAQYQEAADSLRPVAGLHCDARVSLLLAAAFEGGGNLPEAEKTLEQAHAVWPSNNSVAASLARQYLGSGQVEQAAQALAHFHATPKTPVQEMQVAVVAFIKSHQLAPAQTVAEMEYKTYPSIQSLLLLANTMQLQGRFKEVVALLNARRDVYSGSTPFLVTLAESEYDSILYDAARDDLKRAIALDGNSYQAHFLLGNVWLKLNKVEDAVVEYRQAIALSPEQPRTHYQLALALQSQHDQAGAEQEITQALTIDSNYAPALIEKGRMLINQNKPSDAVTQLKLAIEDNPNAEQGYFLLAKAYAQLGDKQKSDEMAKRMVMVRDTNWKSSGNKDTR